MFWQYTLTSIPNKTIFIIDINDKYNYHLNYFNNLNYNNNNYKYNNGKTSSGDRTVEQSISILRKL